MVVFTSSKGPSRPAYKKTIFKSRLKNVEEVKEAPQETTDTPADDPFSNDFDRVKKQHPHNIFF